MTSNTYRQIDPFLKPRCPKCGSSGFGRVRVLQSLIEFDDDGRPVAARYTCVVCVTVRERVLFSDLLAAP